MRDLQQLMDFISQRYQFTPGTYPDLAGLDDDRKQRFAITHSVLHMSKSLGQIAAEAERADHGGQMDGDVLYATTTKMLVNVLKLADELGIRASDLITAVPQVMRSK